MRKIAPFLTIALVVAGFWWALEGAPVERPREPGRSTRRTADAAEARGRPPESRPESAPETRADVDEPESRPESQPESRPESGPVEPVVVFVVAREDGRPVPLATIALRGDVTDLAQTDEAGKAQIHARPGVTVEASVTGEVFYPFATTVLLDSGTREIVIPTRSTVAGHVLVDGKPPVDPVLLLLQHTLDPEAPEQPPDLRTVVGPDGRFEFFNLPESWHGVLSLPADYVFSSDESYALGVPRPNPEITINLTELPVVRGRLVSSGTKEPIYGAIQIKAESEGPGGSAGSRWTNQVFSTMAGRFRVYVDPHTTKVTLELSDATRLGTRTMEIAGPFDVVRNLGDIEIGAVRDLVFRVRDAESRPVAGAVASIPETWSRSEPTGEDGRAAIKTDSNKRELRVAKLGYATAVLPLPESLPTTLDVRLEAGSQLTVDVRLPNGSVPDNGLLLLVLRSETPMFTGTDGMSEEMFLRTGASEPTDERTVSTGASSVSYMPERGRVVVGGFRPGASFGLELRGIVLNDLLVEDHVIMPVTGAKELTLRLPRMPQTFVGFVRGADAKPIEGVSGRLFLGTSEYLGRYVTGPATWSSPQRTVRRHGRRRDREGPLRPDSRAGRPVHRGRRADLHDDRGPCHHGGARGRARPPRHGRGHGRRPVPEIHSVGERYGTTLGAGRYEIDELPPGSIDLDVTLGVTSVIAHHDTQTPLARVVVPTEGTAELHWRRNRGDPVHCRITLAVAHVPLIEIDVPADLGDHWLDVKAPPGIYVATVEARNEDSEEWHAIGTSKAFEIAAHLATSVELKR